MPVRMFIKVDLPAPFSPSKAWTSPGRTSRSMASLATRPGNSLVIPTSSTFGPAAPADCAAGAAKATGPAIPSSGGFQSRDALDGPIPIVESHVVHGLALGDPDLAVAVLDLADEGRIAAFE